MEKKPRRGQKTSGKGARVNQCNSPNERSVDGKYTNYCTVCHNAFEFLLEFGQFSPKDKNTNVHTRIVASPACIKFLAQLLRESIEQYDRMYEQS